MSTYSKFVPILRTYEIVFAWVLDFKFQLDNKTYEYATSNNYIRIVLFYCVTKHLQSCEM
jgi:hypothetical protein